MDELLIRLGPEFTNAALLSIPEVSKLLARIQQQDPRRRETNFEKFLYYSRKFDYFPDPDIADQLREFLTEHNFTQAEVVLMMNLCPKTTEEARILIPSLQDRDDEEELEFVLDELARLKNMCGN